VNVAPSDRETERDRVRKKER
jgi:hypothetical protein